MIDVNLELKKELKDLDGDSITFINYVKILNDIFERNEIEKDPKIFAKAIESSIGNELLDIENILKAYKFDSAKEKSGFFFGKFDSLEDDFAKEVIRNLNISNAEKNIFIAVISNENGVADFIANKCLEYTEANDGKLRKSIESLILSDEMHEKLSKKLPLTSDDASFFLFFDYVRQQVLPSMNHESVMKFYMYVESGNFEKALKNDLELKEAFTKKDPQTIQETLFKKIKQSQIGLKLVHDDKSSDYTAKIQIEKLPETYLDKLSKTSPSGFIDYAIADVNDPKKIHIVNVKAATIESDIYKHDEKSIVADRALKNWARLNNYTLVIHESQGSHRKEKILKHFLAETRQDLKDEDFLKIKEVLDTVINRFVDYYTGTEKNIIQPGDCKYTSEHLSKEPPYKVFLELAKMINNDEIKLNTSNDSIFKVVSKSLSWLDRNLEVDPDFLSEHENIKDLRHELKGLRNKFSEKDLISGNIKRLLSDTTPTVIVQKINEARLNKVERKVKEEESFLKSINHYDLINDRENRDILELKHKIYKYAINLSNAFISLELDNRINARKMIRIKEKYQILYDNQYSVNYLLDDGEKIYFKSQQFKAKESYQKDIEQLFKITENNRNIFDSHNIEKIFSKVIKELKDNLYTDVFDNIENSLLMGNKIYFLNNYRERFIKEAKDIIKDTLELIPSLKGKVSQRMKTEIEPKIKDLSEQYIRISRFRDQYDEDGEMDLKTLDSIEKYSDGGSRNQIKKQGNKIN